MGLGSLQLAAEVGETWSVPALLLLSALHRV